MAITKLTKATLLAKMDEKIQRTLTFSRQPCNQKRT